MASPTGSTTMRSLPAVQNSAIVVAAMMSVYKHPSPRRRRNRTAREGESPASAGQC